MNTKAIRKDYDKLSMLQRLALLDNAISRDDESEAHAVVAASPRKTFSQTDYLELFEKISMIRLCNLIVRLGYLMSFDFLLNCWLKALKDKSDLKEGERLLNDLKFGAFLYVRTTDSWQVVNDELGLRPKFDEEVGEAFFMIDMLRVKDPTLRKLAFSEDEARAHMLKKTGNGEIRTIEEEIEGYREILGLTSA